MTIICPKRLGDDPGQHWKGGGGDACAQEEGGLERLNCGKNNPGIEISEGAERIAIKKSAALPAKDTAAALAALLRKCDRSNPSPTRNM